MFNFMKKSSSGANDTGATLSSIGIDELADKEKRKKEKKERKDREKKRDRASSGNDEPLRLEEVRRSLKLRGRRKDKEKLPSGITADYTENFFAQLNTTNYTNIPVSNSGSNSNLSDETNHLSPNYTPNSNWNIKADGVLRSDSSETSLNSLNNPNANSPRKLGNLPPVPPRPPKRGILKGSRLSNTSSNSQDGHSTDATDYHNGQDPNLLIKNTLQNEVISYRLPKSSSSNDDISLMQSFTKKVLHSPVDPKTGIKLNGIGITSASPSADSLTESTTHSSFATPPFSASPVGESQGFLSRWSMTNDEITLPLPELKPLQLPNPRVLTIQRQKPPRNDFGFSLRIAVALERREAVKQNGHVNGDSVVPSVNSAVLKHVILAEPGSSAKSSNETGLLPGDRLLEVNGVCVEGRTREEIIELIKSSQDSVTIKVQPIGELCELSMRRAADGASLIELPDADIRSGTLTRSGSRRFGRSQAKTEEQLATENEWLKQPRLWLSHRSGYTAVRRETTDDNGRVQVKIEATGEIITVDEDDLEQANPPSLERCEDIAQLRCLTECSALHVLRARVCSGLYYTRAGHTMLVVGPPHAGVPIYTDKVARLFRGCRTEDMPPHVFAAAQSAHRTMLSERRDRALVYLGRSGSGKTTAMRQCLWYLATVAAPPSGKLTADKLDSAFNVLEAFGNCRTPWSNNSTRFICMTTLDFDGVGYLVSASIQTLLHDLRPTMENTFHSLYRLLHGCDGRLRRELYLDQVSFTSNQYVTSSVDVDCSAQFVTLAQAMSCIGVTEKEQRAVWSVLAAICHLGWAGTTKVTGGNGSRYQWSDAVAAERAARLLGTTRDTLTRALFTNDSTGLRTPSPSNDRDYTGQEMLDGFVNGLYNELFNIIVALINRCITTSLRSSASIILLDAPGAYNPLSAGHQGGTSLYKLMTNYIQERLQATFHESMLVAPRERYSQEGININGSSEEHYDWLSDTVNPGPMVELLDRSPQSAIVRTSQNDLRDCDRRGILWLLEEESMYPGSSDDTFLERVFAHASPGSNLIRKAPHSKQFILNHLQGTNPVLYDVTGWVKASRENPVTKKSLPILQESQIEEISSLFNLFGGTGGNTDTSTLRRASSIRRPFVPGGTKRRSMCALTRWSGDALCDVVRRSNARYICCILAQHHTQSQPLSDVNVPLVRSQFRGFQLLDSVRLYKQGFPEHMPLSEFTRRYCLLASQENSTDDSKKDESSSAEEVTEKQLIDDMLLALDLDMNSYRLGLTQILFRPGVVASLDARRDAALGRVLVRLQARARGLLGRRKAEKLRTQHIAARCIQRNVRAFMDVRDWPWWRLLVRVTPLLAVHRTEERLKNATDEIESMKVKIDKLEQERTYLKNENDILERKLSECNGELSEERSAAAQASERAEAEAAERLRIERDVKDLATTNERLQQTSERLELELLHWRSASESTAVASDSEADSGDGDGNSDRYRRRYETAARELQLLKAQLRRQHEDDLEQLVTVKKQFEKKVADALEEVEEQRAVAAQWKRKVQKLTNDMADLKSLLDEQTCRNNLLEKRQRKFDTELSTANEELRRERTNRERISRERDLIQSDKATLEQTVQELRLDLEMKDERLQTLSRSLDEASDEGEVSALKRAKADLERKLRDHEEELDDLAGQIQLLESSKLRLEMALEQHRKETRLEAVQRDEELEEARANHAKKTKMLESQLESEHSERTLLLREKHELERRLQALEEAARTENQEQSQLIQRLKRDLKRYRALLRDAQIMLEQKEKDSGNKAQIRQLKNQVEELEVSLRASQKARSMAESEASECSSALEEANRARAEAADRANSALKELAALRAQLDDADDELQEMLGKYRTSAASLVTAQAALREAETRAETAERETRNLKDRLRETEALLTKHSDTRDAAEQGRRLELRTKELESSLEMEQTSRARLESQLARLKENQEKLNTELTQLKVKEAMSQEQVRKLLKQVRESKEEALSTLNRLEEANRARASAEEAATAAREAARVAREEARANARRADALSDAIHGDLSSLNNSPDSESENDSYSSDESIETFLANHKLSPMAPSRASNDLNSKSSEGRQSRTSVSSSKPLTPTKETFIA